MYTNFLGLTLHMMPLPLPMNIARFSDCERVTLRGLNWLNVRYQEDIKGTEAKLYTFRE